MHRNTFLNSPGLLDAFYQFKARPGLFFAGQMTGVEGYVESAASGLTAGLNAAMRALGRPMVDFKDDTAIGSLAHYVSRFNRNFQPMNVTFGLMAPLDARVRDKQKKAELIAKRALDTLDKIRTDYDI
jgi:methylenetetrahydrofolate--tRNA-(uracil-5-)-methyltransferase